MFQGSKDVQFIQVINENFCLCRENYLYKYLWYWLVFLLLGSVCQRFGYDVVIRFSLVI